ncbi:MAG TPA: LLM class flavin-dependent oxidoreductase [Micropepsaceae bacterium]|nr:LLM class flavin-dependent oxidoreductase [Micropepsaceae bacterium]
MIPISVLDLCPIVEGGDAATALRNAVDLARHAEEWGYRRYWLAEHHNMPGIASAATSVVIGHVAGATKTIRVGAGGIMLPNHSPLIVAEQFGTLATLYPGRIDLGIGRAPGTDQRTMYALRRNLIGDFDSFPQDVMELITYLSPLAPGQAVHAIPGAGTEVPVWILGSSLYGAQLAAALGLPYAFASHFAPEQLEPAITAYRERFHRSRYLSKPYVMLGISVFAAETDADARMLFTSQQQAVIHLRSGRPGQLPPPIDDIEAILDDRGRAILDSVLTYAIVGSRGTVMQRLQGFVDRHRPDELMVTANIFDHAARLTSFRILSEISQARSS